MNQIECACECRLAADPEERVSQKGKPYVRLRGAVGSEDSVQWLQITAIGEQAVASARQLAKGDCCYIEGSIKLDRWTAQDGTERSGLSVLAWKAVPLAKIGRQKLAQARQPGGASQADPGNNYAAVQGKRDWQRPVDTDPRPAAGPGWQPDDAIPFAPEVR
jgi:single-stranded DNA-binding protein